MRRSITAAICATLILGPVALPMAHADDPDSDLVQVQPASELDRARPGLTGDHPAGTTQDLAEVAPASLMTEVDRFWGSNRYATAVAISEAAFPEGEWFTGGSVGVLIASGTNYPDALAGAPMAAVSGPILLVPPSGKLPAVVHDELARLDVAYVERLGGPTAVSHEMLSAAAIAAGLDEYHDYAGKNRYDTAAMIAVELYDWLAAVAHDMDTVVITSGRNYADALAGGSSAAHRFAGLLLTDPGFLPVQTRDALHTIDPSRVEILGGSAAVNTSVLNEVKAALPNANVVRISGDTRYETAAAVSVNTYGAGGLENGVNMFLAYGHNFPDALAAGPLGAWGPGPTLLTRTACAPEATIAEDTRLNPAWRVAIGGENVVSNNALNLTPCN